MDERAKRELELIGAFDEKGDFYGGMTGKAVQELYECFEKQGHSGMSAGLVSRLFKDLVDGKPLSPLKFTDDEWDTGIDERDTRQNNRCYAVFCEADNKPYYIDAIVWSEEDGCAFTGTVAGFSSKQYFGKNNYPKTFYVKVDKDRNIIDTVELQKALEYYS